jgi:DNA-binding response OmpR family regulator
MRVLIVDDDPAYLAACAAALGAHGHDVVAAGSFGDGRRLLAHAAFDLLIVDVRLGAYNGLHLLVLAPPGTVKIAMSAFVDRVLVREAEQFGGRFVEKPRDYATLTALLTWAASSRDVSHEGPPAGDPGETVYVGHLPGRP